MIDDVFKKYYAKIRKESIINSVLCGLAAGFGAVAIVAFICWMTEFSPVWICPVAFVACGGVCGALTYALVFRPTFSKVAQRMDALGLEERMITMLEFQTDESPMANVQRSDALSSAGKMSASLIKLTVSVAVVAAAAVGFALGGTFMTVDALSEAGVIKSGKEIAYENANLPSTFTIDYGVKYNGTDNQSGGLIVGDDREGEVVDKTSDRVTEGTDGVFVWTVDGTDSFLAGWEVNGGKYEMGDPYRQEKDVNDDMKIVAVYDALEKPVEDNKPLLGGGGGSGPSGGNGDDSGSGGNEGIDRTNKASQVLDGKTHYGDTYGDDLSSAMDAVSGNDSISSGESDIIGDYFGTIAP